MKRIVCLAYYFRSLFLRYISVQARDVHCFSDQVQIFDCLITEKTLMQIKYHLAFLFFRYSNAYEMSTSGVLHFTPASRHL